MHFRRIAAVCALILAPVVLWGCQGEKAPTQPPPHSTSGSLHITSVFEVPESAIAALPSEAVQEMTARGWVRTERGFERQEDPTAFTVRSGGVDSKVQPDGVFQIADSDNYGLVFKDQPVLMDKAPITTTVDAQGRVHMTATLSVRAHSELHNQHAEHHTGATLPCLDYNGPYGNQKDNQGWWQDSINFIGSDCDAAFYICMWYDFTKSPICNGSFNCSSLIGHCTGYHKHTRMYSPKC